MGKRKATASSTTPRKSKPKKATRRIKTAAGSFDTDGISQVPVGMLPAIRPAWTEGGPGLYSRLDAIEAAAKQVLTDYTQPYSAGQTKRRGKPDAFCIVDGVEYHVKASALAEPAGWALADAVKILTSCQMLRLLLADGNTDMAVFIALEIGECYERMQHRLKGLAVVKQAVWDENQTKGPKANQTLATTRRKSKQQRAEAAVAEVRRENKGKELPETEVAKLAAERLEIPLSTFYRWLAGK